MRITLLDASTLGADLDITPLGELGTVKAYASTAPDEIADHCKDSDVLVINKVKINETTLPDTMDVKLICLFATGYDNVDVKYCRKKGIGVCNVVGYSTDSVAQVTVAQVLSLCNHLPEYTRHVTSGAYTAGGVANCLIPVYRELCGKTWGIIGYGNIGKRVAKVADALGCRVVINRRTPGGEYENLPIDQLCKEADVITIHTPLSDSTYHLINDDRISLMKKDVIVVNVARGAVVDEAAMARAVLEGRVGAFGTDVYSAEPMSADHPFNDIMHMDNVCLTPHMAWGAFESRTRCLEEIVKNITAFTKGESRCRVDLA